MAYLDKYLFNDLNTGKFKPEESFNDDYIKKLYES